MKGPVYLRLGKKNEPTISHRKKIGNLDIIIDGKTNLLISVGNIIKEAIETSKKLKKTK